MSAATLVSRSGSAASSLGCWASSRFRATVDAREPAGPLGCLRGVAAPVVEGRCGRQLHDLDRCRAGSSVVTASPAGSA